jgi:hypothetical protein
MKHEIRKDGELIATIETHGDAVVVVHEPQPEENLIGKWVRCLAGAGVAKRNAWYKCIGFWGDKGLNFQDFWLSWNFIDLSNPRDTNPDEEERVIPFDIERWRKGDYVRVQTRGGREVTQLTWFEVKHNFPLFGVLNWTVESWKNNGHWTNSEMTNPIDLTLVVKGGSND